MTIQTVKQRKTTPQSNQSSIVPPTTPGVEPSPEPETPTRRVQHPIFADCAQFTLDPYWQQVFEECSRGKFPRGSGIDNEGKVVYFRGKNGSNQGYVSYKLKKNPEQVFKDLKQLFLEQLNLKSNRDKQVIRAELDDICKDLQESFTGTWQKIKRKRIKDPIIRRYILDLKSQYELNDKETAEVAQIIRLGFLFNWIDNDQVVYENQRIVEILSLRFDPEDRSFELEEPTVVYKREYKPKLIRLSSLWEKNLEKPKNRYIL